MNRNDKNNNTARFEWSEPFLDLLSKPLGINFSDPAQIRKTAESVSALHTFFTGHTSVQTKQRRNIRKYGSDHDTRQGYALYYLLVNVPKIVFILESNPLLSTFSFQSILDIGSGPGTAGLAYLIAASENSSRLMETDITAVDTNPAFLKLCRFLLDSCRSALHIPGKTKVRKARIPFPVSGSEDYDLIFAANVLGEIKSDGSRQKLRHFFTDIAKPGTHLVLMEPALRSNSRNLLQLRDELVKRDWNISAPCPGNYTCPVLRTSKDWCHHRLAWNPPQFIRKIDSLTGLDKRILNFSFCCLQKNGTRTIHPTPSGPYIAVSDLREEKGQWSVFLCGNAQKLQAVLQKKHIVPGNRELLSVRRYEKVLVAGGERVGTRLLITQNTRIQRTF